MSEFAANLHICRADYANPVHATALVSLLDAYARDPMGGGEALSRFAKEHLISALAARPQAFSVLAFADQDGALPVGLVNCIEGFSTFACRPLVNVHDVVVLPGHRGQRIAEQMLALVETIASERGPASSRSKSCRAMLPRSSCTPGPDLPATSWTLPWERLSFYKSGLSS